MIDCLAITKCTIKELASSVHYKILFFLLSLVQQFSFLIAAGYQTQFAIQSPNLGYNATQFLVGNVDSLHFLLLQFVVVALTLVHFERMCRTDMMEAVQCKQYTNVVWTAGTALGISLLVFLIPLVNFIAIYVLASQPEVFGVELGPAPELMSALNLILVDVPTSIVFYCALTLVLRQIFKSKTLTGLSSMSIALLHLILIQAIPFCWREIASYSTTHSMLVSEILPHFSSGWVLFNRFIWILITFAMLVFAALLSARRDVQRALYLCAALALMGVSIAGLLVHGCVVTHEGNQREQVATTHQTSSDDGALELTNISGKVEIYPGVLLLVDMNLSVYTTSDSALESLRFSFNPGMSLQHVRVDGLERDFSFKEGLLIIPIKDEGLSKKSWIVSIKGSGVPDVKFGYPEPKRDFLRTAGVSPQVPKLLGLTNSIFDRRFVALMPGSRWYPVPLPLGIDKAVQSMVRTVDTFAIDLDVLIANKNWMLAAPERELIQSVDSRRYRIHTKEEVPHFAIVASKFQSLKTHAAGVELELLIDDRHVKPTKSMNAVWNLVLSTIGDRLVELGDAGMPFPYRSLTFVEVPNHLRLIGGHDMPLLYSQPGVVFIRESGFPTAKLDRLYEAYMSFEGMSNSERQENFAESLFFYDYTNILGGNILTAVASQYFPFLDQPVGWEGFVVNFMKRLLIGDIVLGPDFYYSPPDIDLIEEIADLTVIYPSTVLKRLFGSHEYRDPTQLEDEAYYRFMLNDASFAMQSMTMPELLQSQDRNLTTAALEIRLYDTYRALVELYGNATLNELLDLETKRLVKQPTVQSASKFSESRDSSSSLLPILSEWNGSTIAPAFSAGELEVVSVSADDTAYTHRASFKLRNDTQVTGVVKFYTDLLYEAVEAGNALKVPGHAAYQVNLYSVEEILGVAIDTCYSENTAGIYLEPLSIPRADSTNVIVEDPLPYITEISWNPNSEDTAIVDNLDAGFSLVGWIARSEPSLLSKIRWPWEPPQLPSRILKGLERFDWANPRANQDWRMIAEPWSSFYGRYRPSTLATHGVDVEVARFTADLAESGTWSLSYHFPDVYSFTGRYGVHSFVLTEGKLETLIQVDPKRETGWIHLGEFEILSPTVNLDLVSVDPPNSLRVADAIRWTLVESSVVN